MDAWRVRSAGRSQAPRPWQWQSYCLLRAYARPYAEATAGTPEHLQFDPVDGILTYRYTTTLPSGGKAGAAETKIRIPAIQYPQGYKVSVDGAQVRSAKDAPILRIANKAGAAEVNVTVTRVGDLPPLPVAKSEPDRSEAALRALPPIAPGPLTRTSLLGHIVVTPGGRALLEREVPGMLQGMSHIAGWEKMTLAGVQQFAPAVLTEQKLKAIDAVLATLKVTPGPVMPTGSSRLSVDSLTSDLLADPRARAILDREAPGLTSSSKQGLFPQTRLRNLQPELPDVLTAATLARIQQALAALK